MKQTEKNTVRTEVGMRIRRERNLWNMTQEDLSQELGISTNYLGQIERGTRDISRKMEDRLCEMFHLTHDEFRSQKPSDPWSRAGDSTEAVFRNMSEEDMLRLLRSCSPDELQFCGHLIRSTLAFLRTLRSRSPLITELNPEEAIPQQSGWEHGTVLNADKHPDGLSVLLSSGKQS